MSTITSTVTSTREYGRHLKLNHQSSQSQPHIEKHQLKLNIQESLSQTAASSVIKLSSATNLSATKFPLSFSLSTKFLLPILNQENLGSCVVTSFASIVASLKKINISRLYAYYVARVATQNPPDQDTGLDILQAMPYMCSFGYPLESIWKYNTTNFSTIPPLTVFKNANTPFTINNKAILQTENAFKTELLLGRFIIFGVLVYDSFLTNIVARNGVIPTPNVVKETLQGGHCIHLVGWVTINNVAYYIIRNSWGTAWGNNGSTTPVTNFVNNRLNGGFAYIPAAYVLNPSLAFEFISVY